jgi:hypothetical protein
MRYRLMATYRGVPYEAGVGPTDSDIVLFAACPPPEDLGFQPATGHWRKPVNRAEVDAMWESRPFGTYRDEPCLVIDDLGEQLHISYAGDDPSQAELLGYCQMEPGVYEVLIPREEVTGITEERVERPYPAPPSTWPPAAEAPAAPVPPLSPSPPPWVAAEDNGTAALAWPAPALNGLAAALADETAAPAAPAAEVPAAEVPASRGRHGGAGARPATRQTFSELVDLASIPQDSYAVDEMVEGAFCLVKTDSGFEVFTAADSTRHEVRVFADEEAAYFYLFGLLAAEAVRDGRLSPPSRG